VSSLSGIYNVLLLGTAYCLTYARLTDACYSMSVSGPGHIYNFSQRQCGWHLDTANQDASNGHIL